MFNNPSTGDGGVGGVILWTVVTVAIIAIVVWFFCNAAGL